MDPTDRLRSWTPRILLFSVLAILVLVGVIQYQWFSRSAAVEIEGTIRGLESNLRQTVLREFQRYAPVAAELEALRGGPAPSESGAKALLDRLMAAYGPRGTAAGLVAWAGLTGPGSDRYRRTAGDGTWAEAPLPDQSWVYELRDQNVPEGMVRQNVLVVRTGKAPGSPVLLVGLDVEAFFRTYVFASLAEAFPGAELSWRDSTRDPPPPGGFDSRTYAFNPLSALVAGTSLPRTLEVMIPRIPDLGLRPQGSRSEGARGDGFPVFRVFSAWNVRVTLPADAPVLGVEGRLAWNWLGSTLLLAVLAGAFALVLRQSARIAALRRREREFVASVSHELRTPLTVIRSAADNFSRGIVAPGRQQQYGHLILDQSLRLGRMIEEMLTFAQTEAAPAPVEALLVFGPWLAELRPPLDTLAAGRQVHLAWDVAGVPAAGRTDPEALRLILENLVMNALNHAYPAPEPDQGPRPVRVTLRHLVPDRLELTVDDDGRGISPKEAKKVFEPFYRDQVSRNNQEKGSGLGLFLAQRQARRLGGNLKLESPWRRLDGTRRPGCRFILTVPFRAEGEGGAHGR